MGCHLQVNLEIPSSAGPEVLEVFALQRVQPFRDIPTDSHPNRKDHHQ